MCHPGIFSSSVRKYLKIIWLCFSKHTVCKSIKRKGLSCRSRPMLAVMPINICNVKNG